MEDLERLVGIESGAHVAANQVYYNLNHRAAEGRVIPWCVRRGVIVQAYTPLDQGRLADGPVLRRIAVRQGVTAAAVALAWTMRTPGVVSIVKTGRPERVRELSVAPGLTLTEEDLRELDAEYPPPAQDAPLETV